MDSQFDFHILAQTGRLVKFLSNYLTQMSFARRHWPNAFGSAFERRAVSLR
jgi:hypothetical protein